jgi:hypothetical protein
MEDMAFRISDTAPNGSLVAMQAAPPSKWYLSWVVDQKWPAGHTCPSYGLESIEDGEVCDWCNISFLIYDPGQVASHPEWRWTDEQHALNDHWFRLCRDHNDGYIYPPLYAEFSRDPDNFEARLGARVKWDIGDKKIGTVAGYVDDWRTADDAALLAAYEFSVAELKGREASVAIEKHAVS